MAVQVLTVLIVALSAAGLSAAWALLRPLRLARDVQVTVDEPDDVTFGFDARGFG